MAVENKKWIVLNNEIMVKDSEGNFQLSKDEEAVKSFFLDNINVKLRSFLTLKEKIDFLITNKYWVDFYNWYSYRDIKRVVQRAYSFNFRFKSYMQAEKFFNSYALKDDKLDETGKPISILERYEDRVSCVALFLAKDSGVDTAIEYVDVMMQQEYQPATPTFLNAGKVRSGELVSCFLDEVSDDLSGHGYTVDSAMQLSKIGGGVSFDISHIRARGEAIKGVEGRASGVMPQTKVLEDTFSYVNQLGQRTGAGAVYLNIFHADIEEFLDCKKINVDEKSRIKSLSIGVTIPSKFMELAEKDEAFYVFYPHNVNTVIGKSLNDLDFDNTNIYQELIDNPLIKKKPLNARNLLVKIAQVQKESGYPYIHFKGNSNKNHALKNIGDIKFSNLCVHGSTQILTDMGYIPIGDLQGCDVNVWNGEEWSKVNVVKTGENQKLVKVITTDGYELECTPYHKFYIQKGYGNFKTNRVEKRAHELQSGDKLIKFELPIIEGSKELSKAYTNGFYSGDGCYHNGKAGIYIYQPKSEVIPYLELGDVNLRYEENQKRYSAWNVKGLKDKYFVPDATYTIDSRLKWLAGILDADGTVTDFESSQTIQIASVHKEFLKEIQLMLQTLGCDSKVTFGRAEGKHLLPANNGTGELKEYDCKEVHRLLINGNSLFKLIQLGIDFKRLKPSGKKPARECSAFIKIKEVVEVEGLHDTFCFTEPKRNMGMFNGMLTGNCTEVLQVSKVSDIKPRHEVSTYNYGISCILGSLNIVPVMTNKSIEKTVRTAMRMLTTVSDITDIKQVPSISNANRDFRSVGLGAMNLHGFLAKNKIMFESEQAMEFADKFFMLVNYYSLSESMEIAKRRNSTFKGFKGSEYENGNYFTNYLQGYSENFTFEKVRKLFEGIHIPTLEEWLKLKEDVSKYGLYNAYRLCIAPNQSTSYIMNATASIMPIVDVIETREYGNSTTYYPMPYLNNSNFLFYKSAYGMNQNKVMRLVATIQKHIDQGISCILHTNSADTTRDLAKYYIVAHKLGLKTLYYTRTRKSSISECISCSA